MEGPGNTPKTLTVRTYARLATCPPRHRYDNACVPPKYSECLRYVVHPCLSRPPTVSYCMPSAIERPSALDRPHTSPVHYANSHEFHGLHRSIYEIIWRGGSYERSVWLHHQHHQWEGLNQCSMGISSYNRRVAAEFLLKLARRHTRSWATTWRQSENTRLGNYGWTASSSLHCAVTCCMLRWKESRQSASSVTTPTSSSSLCTEHRGCGSSTTSKWRSGMAMSWTSTKPLSS